MTFKDFQQLKESKSPEEFKAWFDDVATWCVDVCGKKILCAKVAKRKAFLRDGTLLEVDDDNKLRLVDGEERHVLKAEIEVLEKYSGLETAHRIEVYRLLQELEAEEEAAKNATCSFCGKRAGKARRLIAGLEDTYICDGCIRKYNKSLNERAAN